MYGRVDFAKFSSGLRTLLNYLIRPHGPVFRRPGTHYICEVKDSTKFTRLLKFEYSTVQVYQIEAGEEYFRFFKDGGRIEVPITGADDNGGGLIRITSVAHGMLTGQQVTIYDVLGTTEANDTWTITVITDDTFDLVGSVFTNAYVSGGFAIPEVVTPYLAADLPLVKSAQNADTMYFVHPDYPVQKLERISHTGWNFLPVNFLPPPTYEAGYVPAYTLTFGATSGIGVVLTGGVGGDFAASDVGRMITINGGTDRGRAIIKTVTSGVAGTVDIVDAFDSLTFAAGAWTINGSPATILTPSAAAPVHKIVTLTLTAAGWRPSDLGRYVRVNAGVARITVVTSTTVVSAELLTVLVNVTASPAGSWSLEDPQYSASRGYPRAIAFFEQRLILGGYGAKPQSFQGTNTAFYEVIALGPDDDDAFDFIVATNEVNAISWMLPTRSLLIGTASSEFAVSGSSGATNAAISPNNVDVKASTFWGSSPTIQPLRIGNAGLFVSRTGTELREMVFSLQRDSYIADDLLLLSEHLTKGAPSGGRTILDLAYQRHPNSVVWIIGSDGVLLGLTYQREHDVVGWSRHITGPDAQTEVADKGKFESVTVTPHWRGDRDVAFFIINRRDPSGVQHRNVEYMDDVDGYYGGLGMDCALVYDGVPTNTVSGLQHLAGETVQILGDGAVYPDAVVTAQGEVTASGLPFERAEIGLGFNSMLQTMTVEVPQQGTSQGIQKHWARILVRCYKTIGMHINGEEKPFRSAQDDMDTAVPLFSGDIKHEQTGRDTEGIITVEQRQPLPQIISAIFGTLEVGN